MGGSAYGIRTRVTAVRGRPEGMPRWDQRGALGHRQSQELWPFAARIRAPFPKASQRRQSRTEHLGCRMVADGACRAESPAHWKVKAREDLPFPRAAPRSSLGRKAVSYTHLRAHETDS